MFLWPSRLKSTKNSRAALAKCPSCIKVAPWQCGIPLIRIDAVRNTIHHQYSGNRNQAFLKCGQHLVMALVAWLRPPLPNGNCPARSGFYHPTLQMIRPWSCPQVPMTMLMSRGWMEGPTLGARIQLWKPSFSLSRRELETLFSV